MRKVPGIVAANKIINPGIIESKLTLNLILSSFSDVC